MENERVRPRSGQDATPKLVPSRSRRGDARHALVGLVVGPGRVVILTAIGGATMFIAAIVIGYLTR